MHSTIEKSKMFLTQIPNEKNNVQIPLKIKALKWTPEEDRILISLVDKYGVKNWKTISEKMEARTSIQCLHRWSKILQPGLVKGPWTVSEDKKLIEWVNKNGAMKWSLCSENIPGRSGKQCRERWYNNLNPNLVKGNWSPKEDYMIFKLYTQIGSKWSTIAEQFKGRTENSIKNRFYSTLRRIASKFNLQTNKSEIDNNNTLNKDNSLSGLLQYVPFALKERYELYHKSNTFQSEQYNNNIQTKQIIESSNQNQSETAVTEDETVTSSPMSTKNEKMEMKQEIPSFSQEMIENNFNNNGLHLLYNSIQHLIAKEKFLTMYINNSIYAQNYYYNLLNAMLLQHQQ
jgi:hypothetical protein